MDFIIFNQENYFWFFFLIQKMLFYMCTHAFKARNEFLKLNYLQLLNASKIKLGDPFGCQKKEWPSQVGTKLRLLYKTFTKINSEIASLFRIQTFLSFCNLSYFIKNRYKNGKSNNKFNTAYKYYINQWNFLTYMCAKGIYMFKYILNFTNKSKEQRIKGEKKSKFKIFKVK